MGRLTRLCCFIPCVRCSRLPPHCFGLPPSLRQGWSPGPWKHHLGCISVNSAWLLFKDADLGVWRASLTVIRSKRIEDVFAVDILCIIAVNYLCFHWTSGVRLRTCHLRVSFVTLCAWPPSLFSLLSASLLPLHLVCSFFSVSLLSLLRSALSTLESDPWGFPCVFLFLYVLLINRRLRIPCSCASFLN